MAATVRQQYHEAIMHYTDAIGVRLHNATYNATLYSERANAYYQLGQHVRAVADCYKAMACDSLNAASICIRGRCFREMGYHSLAIKVHPFSHAASRFSLSLTQFCCSTASPCTCQARCTVMHTSCWHRRPTELRLDLADASMQTYNGACPLSDKQCKHGNSVCSH